MIRCTSGQGTILVQTSQPCYDTETNALLPISFPRPVSCFSVRGGLYGRAKWASRTKYTNYPIAPQPSPLLSPYIPSSQLQFHANNQYSEQKQTHKERLLCLIIRKIRNHIHRTLLCQNINRLSFSPQRLFFASPHPPILRIIPVKR